MKNCKDSFYSCKHEKSAMTDKIRWPEAKETDHRNSTYMQPTQELSSIQL